MPLQDHVAFRVSDMEAALNFYEQTLGLRRLSCQTDEDHHERFAFLELDGGNLELLQPLDESNRPVSFAKPTVEAPYCPHLAIRTGDLDAVADRLRERGVPIVKGPLQIPGQVRWLYLADPDNNIIEFVQWL
ncbi:MAG TPA: VOC family protein [Candidatus Hydrogenedentes bacterium]|nr:VOC family protein [Candidatus Hydrogenedentota bacterium]